MVRLLGRSSVGAAFAFVLLGTAVACGTSSHSPPTPEANEAPPRPGSVIVPAGDLPAPATGSVITVPGGTIHLLDVGGTPYLPIEATFDDVSFGAIVARATAEGLDPAGRDQLLQAEVDDALRTLRTTMPVLLPELRPGVGYFTAYVPLASYEALKSLKPTRTLLVNPVVRAPMAPPLARDVLAERLASPTDGRATAAGFSGLLRIGVPEILQTLEQELGEVPDGSRVRVGVVDTGVTYNHPALADASGRSRVVYMKDFTNEGRIFFSPRAKLQITIPAELPPGADPGTLDLDAEFLEPVPGVNAAPLADAFSRVEKLRIVVPPELRAVLTTPGSGARLGAFSEKALGNGDGVVDLNGNGSSSDRLWAIFIPGKNGEPDAVYVDLTTRGDFRTSPKLHAFNLRQETQRAFSERFGLDLRRASILNAAGNPEEVITAAIVGYDPGSHGSHVSGIIAGRKTIANDADSTWARGVAPATTLLVDRVCSNAGGCNASLALIDLAEAGAELVNMSIGGLSAFNDGYGVQETIINRLTAQYDTLFFISAGNSGPGRNTVGSPSVARYSISVAATASRSLIERQYQWPGQGKPGGNPGDDDFVFDFSSRGPTAAGGFKPDLAAPGTELSSVNLNVPAGGRPGLDVYWGTSMAAPTATGAAALLKDAIKRYNARFPATPLASDALTLRRVLTASARPFDVTTFDPKTGTRTQGQYTWIDQGLGMIDLPRAWAMLKAERDSRAPAAVTMTTAGATTPVTLDYQLRVLQVYPNGTTYNGSSAATVGQDGTKEPRFGRGVWLDPKATDAVVPVQIARRLPAHLLAHPEVGELERALATTADTFDLETTIHGSDVDWLKAGTLLTPDCSSSPDASVTVVGRGAIDGVLDRDAGTGTSSSPGDSTLYLCVDRSKVDALPPGDHGAVIKAYRRTEGRREAVPTFVVPVYMTKPHKLLAGATRFELSGSLRSMEVRRSYVEVPTGTTLVKVSLETPAATRTGTALAGCGGVRLSVLEAGNTLGARELNGRSARSCSSVGVASPEASRKVSYVRTAPKAGVWDLSLFGLYTYPTSAFSLSVDFATIKSSLSQIAGGPAALNGSLDVEVAEASYPITVSPPKSTYRLTGFAQEGVQTITTGQKLRVPDTSGAVARKLGADVVLATFSTGGSKGNDIDLSVLECTDAAATQCTVARSSAGATDVETASVAPKADRFYVVEVTGYSIASGPTATFSLLESLTVKAPNVGTVTRVEAPAPVQRFAYAMDTTSATLLADPRYTTGVYRVQGELTLADAEGTALVRVPLAITRP